MADRLYTGRCVGGRLDGLQVTVRSDRFLAADKAAGKAWIYQQHPDGTFVVNTDHDDSLDYPDGPTTGERSLNIDRAVEAALGPDLDVVAVPGPGDGS